MFFSLLIIVRATLMPIQANNLYPIDYIDFISILAWIKCFNKNVAFCNGSLGGEDI